MYTIRTGKIYEIREGREIEFVSPFAQEYFDQENLTWERGAWKRGRPDDTAMVTRGMLWGSHSRGAPPLPPRAKLVTQQGTRLYYILEMSISTGLFYYDLAAKTETRLFHRAEFQPHGLFVCDDFTLITTVANPDGTVHLNTLDANGKSLQVLTTGDCIDENPFREGQAVYYQSSGLARNDAGQIAGTSPIAIYKLDMATGEIDTLLSSEHHDYLLPRIGRDGSLYCIETTYLKPGRYSPLNIAWDVIMFPWRMCVAIFGFLNVFSQFFGKKPLTTSGGPLTPPVDISQRLLHNRLIDLEALQRKEGKKVAVSRDWKLIKLCAGTRSVIASNVLWYTLRGDDTAVYTDGYGIYAEGGTTLLTSDGIVTALSESGG